VLCIGTGPIFVKFVHAAGSLVGFYRLLFAALFLTLPVLIRNQRAKTVISKGAVKWAILGGIAFSVNEGLWITALSMTTASKVTLLDNTAPILAVIWQTGRLALLGGIVYHLSGCGVNDQHQPFSD
jgi:drug/metabolite transporter (DMT)-like permease